MNCVTIGTRRKRSAVLFSLLLSILLVAGCTTQSQSNRFMHKLHRTDYRLTDEEIKELQFYISTNVLGTYVGPGDPAGPPVVRLPMRTPGLVTDVGPNWIRVAFEEGGPGAPFVTDTSMVDDTYWLATEVEGREGFHKIRELPGRIYLHQGAPYEIGYGANSVLVVSRSDLDELIKKRKRLRGWRKDEPDRGH